VSFIVLSDLFECRPRYLGAAIEPPRRRPVAAMGPWALRPGARQLGGPCPAAMPAAAPPDAERSGLRREGARVHGRGDGDEGERADIVYSRRGLYQRQIGVSAVARAASTYPRHAPVATGRRGRLAVRKPPALMRKQVVPGAPKKAQNQFRECYNPIPTVLSIL
jgi:hypothetical protein